MKDKERPKNCFRLKKSRDMTILTNSPGPLKTISEITGKIQLGSVDSMIVLCQCSFPDFGGCTDVTQQMLQCSELCLPKIHMLKSLTPNVQQHVNRELPDVQAGFRKGRGARDQIANIRWIIEKARAFHKITYFCSNDYAKAFDCVDHNKLENSERDGNTRPLDLPLEKSVCRSGNKLEVDMEQQTGSKQGEEYVKAVYCCPAYLTYMQSTS